MLMSPQKTLAGILSCTGLSYLLHFFSTVCIESRLLCLRLTHLPKVTSLAGCTRSASILSSLFSAQLSEPNATTTRVQVGYFGASSEVLQQHHPGRTDGAK